MPSKQITNENFFVIRSTRMPFNSALYNEQSRSGLLQLIQDWLLMPEVFEALYLASPSLVERIPTWQQKPDSKEARKVEQSLLKYMIRMCTRPTPFGLFSGVHVGKIDDKNVLLRNELNKDTRKTRLDMHYLLSLREHASKSNLRSNNLRYYLNPSHYFVDNQCRYIEAYQSQRVQQYRLSAVESDEYFQFVIETVRNGASLDSLTAAFLNTYVDANKQEVDQYIQQLISEAILVPDIPIPLTGKSSSEALAESMQKCGATEVADSLAYANNAMREIDAQSGANIEDYKKIVNDLKSIPVDLDESKLFQADLYEHFDQCILAKSDINALKNNLILLKNLSHLKIDPLKEFKQKFTQRYDGQFVPLISLLDDETGISISSETGYEAPLLAGLNLSRPQYQSATSQSASALDNILIQAMTSRENIGKDVICLRSKDLMSYNDESIAVENLPASFAAMISLFEDSQSKPVIKLIGGFGPSAANLLGRFCHLHEDLLSSVRSHLRKEEELSPDVLFAEIAHMPEGRPGNVIARPNLRDYEIVFMADSSLDSEYQIPVNDLYVWQEENKLKLWSKRLNKQIIPRLSCAHNYSSKSLSVYKFLNMLQSQSGQASFFNLPALFQQASFTPRIMLDNLILSEKKWRIPRKDLMQLLDKNSINTERLAALKRKYGLDDVVAFTVSDNTLYLNINNPLMLEVLLNETKHYQYIDLKEMLISHFKTPVHSKQGHFYSNEIVLPFLNNGATSHKTINRSPQSQLNVSSIPRKFPPGSEWASLKLYSGNSVVEDVLTEDLLPLLESAKGNFEKWFFIRFGDPEWHIRIRFYGRPEKLYGSLLPLIQKSLASRLQSGEIHRIELFTYEREIERYGGEETMPIVESLFMVDSELVAKTIQMLAEFGEEFRWRMGSLVVNALLELFEYTDSEKLNLLTHLRNGFGKEFGESATLRKQLGSKFRKLSTELREDIEAFDPYANYSLTPSRQALFDLLNGWYENAKPLTTQILSILSDQDDFKRMRDNVVGSIIHMHYNRMFKAYGREQELVMHDFLRRICFSKSKKDAR